MPLVVPLRQVATVDDVGDVMVVVVVVMVTVVGVVTVVLEGEMVIAVVGLILLLSVFPYPHFQSRRGLPSHRGCG